MTDKAFAAGVRQRRLRNKWSQKHLASLIGINRASLSKVERGVRGVSVATQQRICTALGVTAATLQRDGRKYLEGLKDE